MKESWPVVQQNSNCNKPPPTRKHSNAPFIGWIGSRRNSHHGGMAWCGYWCQRVGTRWWEGVERRAVMVGGVHSSKKLILHCRCEVHIAWDWQCHIEIARNVTSRHIAVVEFRSIAGPNPLNSFLCCDCLSEKISRELHQNFSSKVILCFLLKKIGSPDWNHGQTRFILPPSKNNYQPTIECLWCSRRKQERRQDRWYDGPPWIE